MSQEPINTPDPEEPAPWSAEQVKVGSGALAKAMMDPFDYSLKLTTGEVIRFEEANMTHPEWLHLSGAREDSGIGDDGERFARGIDVRLSQIVWVKDAPYGS